MKRQSAFAIFALLVAAIFVGNANAQYSVYNQNVNRNAKPGEAGFIGLSKKPIDPNNLAATEWTKDFANGEYIYGVVYFPKPLSEYADTSNAKSNKKDMVIGGFMQDAFTPLDGLSVRIYPTAEQMNQTYATFAVFPDPKSNFSFSDGISGYSNVEYFIKDSSNERKKYGGLILKFDAPGGRGTVAELKGISIDFSDFAPYLAMQPAYKKSQGQEMSKHVVDKPLEPAAMNNAAMQKQFMTLLASQLGGAKLLKMNILSPQWQVVRHEVTGVIVGRYIATRSIVKEVEGYCRTRYGLFMQDANGAGYGQTYVNSFGATDDWVIPCERAK